MGESSVISCGMLIRVGIHYYITLPLLCQVFAKRLGECVKFFPHDSESFGSD